MRPPGELAGVAGAPRLRVRREGERSTWWTESLAGEASIYGERSLARREGRFRGIEPGRSKLGAALVRGLNDPLPRPGERWLYLGAASGTTASHVADLVGPSGAVYAVEMSVRPFLRLLRTAEAYPNLAPILADARVWEAYSGLVPSVDGLYADIAQPDQVAILRENASEFLRRGGSVLFALKTASMGRERSPEEHLALAVRELRGEFTLAPPLRLDPFHRQHYFLAGRFGRGGAGPSPDRTSPRPPPAARLRRDPGDRRRAQAPGRVPR